MIEMDFSYEMNLMLNSYNVPCGVVWFRLLSSFRLSAYSFLKQSQYNL